MPIGDRSPVCRKESQCRLDADHWGACAPAKLSGKYDFLKGPIYDPPIFKWNDEMPNSTLVVGASAFDATRIRSELGLRATDSVAATPQMELAGLRFTKVYADVNLVPELRTEYEDAWFERLLSRLPGVVVTYVDL